MSLKEDYEAWAHRALTLLRRGLGAIGETTVSRRALEMVIDDVEYAIEERTYKMTSEPAFDWDLHLGLGEPEGL